MSDRYSIKSIFKGGLTCVIFAFLLSFSAEAEERRIELWVCPAGGYSEESAVRELTDDYRAIHPEVEIDVKILDETSGEDETAAVLGTQDAPDLVLASPEKIVTEWASAGHMADLGQLWDDQTSAEVEGGIREACFGADGNGYMMPLFKDVYTMAVNYEMFRDTGILQYLNEDVHSWKDSGFIDCILVFHDYILQHENRDAVAAKIPCADRKDQRYFMSFITNLSNGSLINDTHTSYKVSSSAVRNSFLILRNLQGKGILYDPEMSSDDELEEFLRGELPITFFWSYYRHQKYAGQTEFTVFPMMYPNSKNRPVLTGDIRGFGVVDSKDPRKMEDAVDFIRFVTGEPDEYKKAVELSECFPVRNRVKGSYVTGLYQSDPDSRLFRFFADYFKDYIPAMPLFSSLEEVWPDAVRHIANGNNVKRLTSAIDEELNGRLEKEYGIVDIPSEEEE